MRKTKVILLVLTFLVCTFPATVAFSQSDEVDPPYFDQLSRLSSIMGALHYLSHLCIEKSDVQWRDQMREMLKAEAPPEGQKSRLIVSFNKGFNDFATTHRQCNASTEQLIGLYLDEGNEISQDIQQRFSE